MGKDFMVKIHNDERAKEWLDVLGTTTIYVESPFPTRMYLPGHDDAEAYMLDLDLITAEQRERLIEHIATKFDIPIDEVQAELDTKGVPILADNCTLTVTNPQKWF
jgi:hypothetical protein